MASVINAVTIAGEVEPVFDLVTTARFWPQWHPATEAVSGVTERPYRLADLISERGKIGSLPFQITWKVAEYTCPERVALECQRPPARITYSFRGRNGLTEFQREVSYEPVVFAGVFPDSAELERFMYSQSQEALIRLKNLIEEILEQERI